MTAQRDNCPKRQLTGMGAYVMRLEFVAAPGRQDRPRHHQRLTRLAYVPAKEDGKIYARARCGISNSSASHFEARQTRTEYLAKTPGQALRRAGRSHI